MTTPPEEPTLHIDSDWKAQAQAEKERLTQKEEQREAKHAARDQEALPPADFRSLVGILASQAMSGLGMYGDEKGRVIVDPIGAKFALDLLGVLEEKTKGNRTAEETTELETILRELRMRFVQLMQMIARQGDVETVSAMPQGARGGHAAAGPALGAPSAGAGTAKTSGAPGATTGSAPPKSSGPRIIIP